MLNIYAEFIDGTFSIDPVFLKETPLKEILAEIKQEKIIQNDLFNKLNGTNRKINDDDDELLAKIDEETDEDSCGEDLGCEDFNKILKANHLDDETDAIADDETDAIADDETDAEEDDVDNDENIDINININENKLEHIDDLFLNLNDADIIQFILHNL